MKARVVLDVAGDTRQGPRRPRPARRSSPASAARPWPMTACCWDSVIRCRFGQLFMRSSRPRKVLVGAAAAIVDVVDPPGSCPARCSGRSGPADGVAVDGEIDLRLGRRRRRSPSGSRSCASAARPSRTGCRRIGPSGSLGGKGAIGRPHRASPGPRREQRLQLPVGEAAPPALGASRKASAPI